MKPDQRAQVLHFASEFRRGFDDAFSNGFLSARR